MVVRKFLAGLVLETVSISLPRSSDALLLNVLIGFMR